MEKPIKLIAVAGGIGSGKSVICRMLRVMGYEVYDCDTMAKALMDRSGRMKQRIAGEIGEEAIMMPADNAWETAVIDRHRLSAIVFSDKEKLSRLNAIVHGEVIADVKHWRDGKRVGGKNVVFVESAVLYTSGLHREVDAIWYVSASESTRIERAMARDNATREQIVARIASQEKELAAMRQSGDNIYEIDNNGERAVLPQVLGLLRKI